METIIRVIKGLQTPRKRFPESTVADVTAPAPWSATETTRSHTFAKCSVQRDGQDVRIYYGNKKSKSSQSYGTEKNTTSITTTSYTVGGWDDVSICDHCTKKHSRVSGVTNLVWSLPLALFSIVALVKFGNWLFSEGLQGSNPVTAIFLLLVMVGFGTEKAVNDKTQTQLDRVLCLEEVVMKRIISFLSIVVRVIILTVLTSACGPRVAPGADLSGRDLGGQDLREFDFAKVNLTGADLSAANLSGVDLRTAILTDANLHGADLSKANLTGQDLQSVDLFETNLTGADLSDVNLYGVYLKTAILTDANLQGADLSEAYLAGQNLQSVNLLGTNLTGAQMPAAKLSGADLSTAIFTDANLHGADLSEANLTGQDLQNVNFAETNLTGADLSAANLSDVNLSTAILTDVNLQGANLSEANLTGQALQNGNFAKTNLTGADLSAAKLASANLSTATLTNANLQGADLSKANLTSQDLQNVNMLGTNLEEAKLSNANMTGIILLEVNMSGADMQSAILDNANLQGASLIGANLVDVSIVGAVLDNANLSDAKGVTDDFLANLASWSNTRLDSDEAILAAFSNICSQGDGVEEAAQYTSGKGIHPIILLTDSGQPHNWYENLSDTYKPLAIRLTQLIVCIEPEEEIKIQTCQYTPPPNVDRFQYQVTIRLVKAQSGRTVAVKDLRGELPRKCGQTESLSTVRIDGSSVTYSQLEDWIMDYVSP